jgi:hypothetical protein
MLLALASVVFLGSESLWARIHILLSQISDFPFRRFLRLARSRRRYSIPPPHWGLKQSENSSRTNTVSAQTAQKTQLYCRLSPNAQKTSHAAIVAWRLTAEEMCLPLRCVATSEARRGYSFSCCVRYPAKSNKHSYFYCCLRVSRFLRFNSSRMGQTSHNIFALKILFLS